MGAYNLATLAERARERFGDDHEELWFDGRWHTVGELATLAEHLSGGFHELGVQPGDRIVVVTANSQHVGVIYRACWRVGAVATPVLFLLPPAELRHVFEDSGAKVVITSPEFVANVLAAAEGLDLQVVTDRPCDQARSLEKLYEAPPVAIVDRADQDLAALLYTGGTTGRSKGVMLSHENLWAAAWSAYRATRDPEVRRGIIPLPLSHSFGLAATIIGQHQQDPGSNVLLRWFDPQSVVDLIVEHEVHKASMVPTMLQQLLTLPLEEYDLSSLRQVGCGGAPMPAQTLQEFERRVPSAVVLEGYGLTETAAAATGNRPDHRRTGTVGTALPDIELDVVDEHGRSLATGEPGEVLVRSPSNALGYWHAPEATASTFVEGWVHTGDVGRLDEEGFLTILDRKKDLVIRNGFNVYPRDVEEALVERDDIASAAVVGRPDPAVGEEVVAFVEATPQVTVDPDELRDWAKERLGPKSYPRDVRLVEAIPLTPVMKIDRKAVRDLV